MSHCIVQKQINVTLPVAVVTQDYDDTLSFEPGPGVSDAKLSEFYCSYQETEDLQDLFLSLWKSETLSLSPNWTSVSLSPLEPTFVATETVDLDTAYPVIWTGESQVVSMTYFDANEGTTNGVLTVLDGYTNHFD